jgi:FtsP/CotA-like multicopper oxidase with cupredoxin domain
VNRRTFLAVSAGSALAACVPRPAPRVLRLAAATQAIVGGEHPATAIWGYDGRVPGPELRFRQGERLRLAVENALEVETTVHWHGIRLPNAMDGVPHVTQAPIAPGGRFVYEFDLPDAGTYWYHPHLASAEQLGRGLYGALIVQEREPPRVDRDLVWVLSDWRLDREARLTPDFMSAMDASHAGRIGNTVTINGRVPEIFAVRAGERVRLRLINAANARIFRLAFGGHEPTLIALDGHPVAAQRVPRIVLGPGMRADLLLDCLAAPGSRHRVVDDFYPRRAYRLVDVVYSADAPLRPSFAAVAPLPPNPVARPSAAAERLQIVFGGGAMRAIPNQREHRGAFWTVNGTVIEPGHHKHEPLFALARGRSYVLELVNRTAWHHPIHLHGHVFRVLSVNGAPPPVAQWGDTVLLDPDSRAEVAFVADNPGDWMLHCHVLEHQESGMSTLVRVT